MAVEQRNMWRRNAAPAHLLALEPRMMFDAAAVATTDAVVGAAAADRDASQHDQAIAFDPHLAAFAPAPADGGAASREIIFIDTSVADYRGLAASWAARGEVVLVNAAANGVDQVQAALAGRTDISAIHIVSHGSAGSLALGTSRIDQAAIEGALAPALAAIGRTLAPDGDILLYGCDFAEGDAGARAIESLARATDADVAASTDLTGAAARGGDWTLEAGRGLIEARALDGGDWNHLLAPVPIAVTADSLTVRDGTGTIVASGATGYTAVLGTERSGLVGTGATATWTGAATFDGQSVDLRATVVSVSTGDQVRFDRPTGASDDAAFLLQSATGTGNATVQLRWELLLSGTDTPLAADVRFTIADIDGIGGNPRTRETLIVATDDLSYFTREQVSDIAFTASLAQVEASGTQNETAAPPLPISTASFDWTDVSAFTITYELDRAGAAQAAFYHDGDADFVFTDPRYVSIPRLDLDADDSTAAGTGAALAYAENAAPIMVVDSDLRVENPAGAVVSATVTLTNARAGDALSLGALPAGISGAIDTSVPGTIRVALTGAATAADYEAAIRAIGFATIGETPDTTTRAVTVVFSNDTLTSEIATSLITVVAVNDPPVAAADGATTPEDMPVTIAVLANDSDADGDPLTVIAASALNGTVSIDAGGTLTYAPNANYNGADTISYTISDGRGATALGTVAVTVTPVNDAPAAIGTLTARTANDAASVSFATAAGFADVDGEALTYSAIGLPPGLAIDAATGLIAGALGRSASQANGGVYAITVTARDAAGTMAMQSFTLTVANPGPIAANDGATTPEDTPVTIAVLANDSDPVGDPLTVTAASALNGSVTINPDGTLTYRPNANYTGADTISYMIGDGEGGTASATVAVTVTPVNDAPLAVGTLPARTANDAASVSYATAGGFADADGEALTYSSTGLPAGLTIDAATGLIAGTLGRSASQANGGSYAITVNARDAAGTTAMQSFALTVTNPGPIAANDGATTLEDTPVTIPVLANDSDPDGDPLTVTAASALNGSVTINPDGTLTYRPNANYTGADTISYMIADGEGGTASATVAVTVTPVNDAPVAIGTLPARTASDAASVSYATAGGFADVDGEALTYSATGLPAGLTIDAATGLIAGTLGRSASQANGGVYTVVVAARDAAGTMAMQSFALTVANPGPAAANDAATTPEDVPVAIALIANDSDPDGDPLTVTAASALNGSVTINPDGTLTYRPNANYTGADTISYMIADGEGGTASATVAVTVTPVNDAPLAAVGTLPAQASRDGDAFSLAMAGAFADIDGDTLGYAATGLPAGLSIDAATGLISGTIDRSASQANGGGYTVAVTARDPAGAAASRSFALTVANPAPVAANDSVVTPEDNPVTIAVLANDGDPDGDPLTVTGASALNGVVAINPAGTLTYRPNPQFNGADTIAYTISDGQGGTASATVAVTVTAVNDAPVRAATLPPRAASDAGSVVIATAVGFADPDGDALAYSASGLPAGLTIDAATGVISGTIGRSASQANGGVYTIVVAARDPANATVAQSFALTVSNPAPFAADDAVTTAEDTPITIAVLGNDGDPDGDPLTVVSASAGHGSVAINPDGTLTYTPDPDYDGTDTIAYAIADGEGGSAAAVVAVTVSPVDDAPVAVGSLPPQASRDGATVSLATAPAFADRDGDALAYSATGLPAGLAIDPATGVITGTIDRSASQTGGGAYAVTVTARDPANAAASQSFTLTVANPAPIARDDAVRTHADTPVTIAVLANDADPDGDPIAVTTAVAGVGSVTFDAGGRLAYRPPAGFTGTDTIAYTIADGQGGTADAIVTVTIDNAPPTATPIAPQTARDGQTIALDAGAAFADVDYDALVFSATGLPPGLAIDPATGVIAGVIGRSASQSPGGAYATVVTADDGHGGRTTLAIGWTIANPAPTAGDDSAATAEDMPVTIAPLVNDADPDGDPLTIVAATAGRGGVTINPDGTLTYTPGANATGSDTIVYTVSDGEGGTATARIAVTIAAVDDAPVSAGIGARGDADAATVSVPLGAGFSDPDGDPLTFSATGLPPGLAIDPATGFVSGAIAPGSAYGGQSGDGVFAVTVTATDPSGRAAATTFLWTIAQVPPIARDDAANTAEDVAILIPVLDNDGDGDLDPLTILSAMSGEGVATIVAGAIRFTPARDFNGVATIRYTIADPAGNQATAFVTVTVSPVNDAPIATADSATVARDTATTIAVLPNDSDPDGDPLAVVAATAGSGVVAINADGTLAYTPRAGFTGSDTITYIIADGQGGTASTTVTIMIGSPSRAPIAGPIADFAAIDGGPVAIAAGSAFSDPDGDTLAFSATGLPPGLTIDPATGAIAGTLDRSASQGGPYAIVVTATDPGGARASASFVLAAANPPPTAQDDSAAVAADATVIVAVLANDGDPDGDPLTVTAASAANGSVVIGADGTLAYTPNAGFAGIDTVAYTISDGNGGNASASVTVTVAAPDRAPVALPIADAAARDGAAVAIAAGAAFADPDGDPLTFAAAGLPPGLTIDPLTGAITGTLDRSASQSGPYRIVVTATDPSGATASTGFTLAVTNPAPIALDDAVRVAEDGAVTIAVLANDRDPDGDPLTVTAASAASGSVTINPDGSLGYRPGANFAGVDIIRYTIADGEGATAQASVTITVDPVNDAPIVAGRDPVLAVGGRPVLVDPLAGVSDADGDPLRLVDATAANGSVIIAPDGMLRYTPPLGFVGDTTIRFTVTDGAGGVSGGVIVVRVADGRGADIAQLLRIGAHALVDPVPRFATVTLADGIGANPIALLRTAEAIRSLNMTTLDPAHPLLGAIEAMRSLRGIGALDPDGPITAEVARERAVSDFRDAGDRLFDQRWGDFLVQGLTGFSAAADRDAGLMFESVVRGGAILVEVRDIAGDGRAPLRSIAVEMAGGGKPPEWVRIDPRGLLIIERAADRDEIHLTIRATRTDGRTSATPVVIQGATGEIELDRPAGPAHRARAAPLDATLHSPRAAADAAAARLAATFD